MKSDIRKGVEHEKWGDKENNKERSKNITKTAIQQTDK